MRRALSFLIGIGAAVVIVGGVYTLAVANRPQYESGETYGGLALALGIAVAALAWVVYPRHRS